ncbi:hypothetical protein BCV71DRAFT_239270 [Rhizopus microsporus]|uniref:Uncharacterized protein n=1 Tax=Rhizopus microsporus TaxID=58291 RepID=A0A1X0RMZ0_RHIZD|nr:hypothetical protein BCV71DRAFT_239270 [Rhizopus microsporus]
MIIKEWLYHWQYISCDISSFRNTFISWAPLGEVELTATRTSSALGLLCLSYYWSMKSREAPTVKRSMFLRYILPTILIISTNDFVEDSEQSSYLFYQVDMHFAALDREWFGNVNNFERTGNGCHFAAHRFRFRLRRCINGEYLHCTRYDLTSWKRCKSYMQTFKFTHQKDTLLCASCQNCIFRKLDHRVTK